MEFEFADLNSSVTVAINRDNRIPFLVPCSLVHYRLGTIYTFETRLFADDTFIGIGTFETTETTIVGTFDSLPMILY